MFGERVAEGFRVLRMLEDEGALNVRIAVKAAGELEVAGADRTYLFENLAERLRVSSVPHLPGVGTPQSPGAIHLGMPRR